MNIQYLEYYVSYAHSQSLSFSKPEQTTELTTKTIRMMAITLVVIGYDKDYLYFEDPWILGSIGYIPKSKFLERGHDIVEDQRKVYNLEIIVKDMQKSHPVIIKLE